MKLGISSFSFSWAVGVPGYPPEHPLSLIDLIERTREYGLNLLQVGDNLPLDQVDAGERERARELLKAYGIQMEVGTRGLTDDILRTYLDIAAYFGSPILRIVIDLGDYEPDEEEIVALLRRWAAVFEEKRICLAIENHDRFTARTLERIIQRTNSEWVGICLDAANSLGALEGIESVAEILAPYTVNLHVKDIDIKRLPSQLGFRITGASAGTGGIDVRWLIDKVRRNGKGANCILEQWTAFRDSLPQTIADERDSADRGVAFLKGVLCRGKAGEAAYGASASYTISRTGAEFTIEDICSSMHELGAIGLSGFQPELSFESALEQWEAGGVEQVNACQEETGVCTRQLICHFVLDYFETEAMALSDAGYEQIERFIGIARRLNNCQQILLPVGPVLLSPGPVTAQRMSKLQSAYLGKLCRFARMIQQAGFKVSFELLPGNYIGSYDSLFDCMEQMGLRDFGVNFDTGHAIANGEDIYRIARDYARRIFLTHLGDPAAPGGTKLAPGCGMIDWPRLIGILRENGYSMALDLEIVSVPKNACAAYTAGLACLKDAVTAATRA